MKQKTIRQIFDTFSDDQKTITYHLVGQALETGIVDRELLVVFDDEQKSVVLMLINLALNNLVYF